MAAGGLSNEFEHVYKLLVIGDQKVGKTSIVKRYVNGYFARNYKATIGVDFALKVLNFNSDTQVMLQVWDLTGQDRDRALTRPFIRGAAGALVVFDVTEPQSFEHVQEWKKCLDDKLPNKQSIPCVLLGNKCDQPKSGIVNSAQEMNRYCSANGFEEWFETSAKKNININEAFQCLVDKIFSYKQLLEWSVIKSDEIQLTADPPNDFIIKSRCC